MCIIDDILDVSSNTREICGVILIDKDDQTIFKQIRNIAPREYEFALHPQEYEQVKSLGEIMYIVHTHLTDSCDLSESDRLGLEVGTIPWVIVSVKTKEYKIHYPSKYKGLPYSGREYLYGRQDCLSIVRDYYLKEYNIELKDSIRVFDWWNSASKYSPYDQEHESWGFYKVDTPEVGDIIVMKINSHKNCHLGIYVGNNKILHHCPGRLSSVESYDKLWRVSTSYFLRHKNEKN
jgi:proteasome lid subunit RPN8/RPN11